MMVDMTPNFLTLKKERLFIIQEMKSLSMEILDIENYLEQINTSVIFEEIMSQNKGVNPVVQKSVSTKTLSENISIISTDDHSEISIKIDTDIIDNTHHNVTNSEIGTLKPRK